MFGKDSQGMNTFFVPDAQKTSQLDLENDPHLAIDFQLVSLETLSSCLNHLKMMQTALRSSALDSHGSG